MLLGPVLAFAAGCSHYELGTEGRLAFQLPVCEGGFHQGLWCREAQTTVSSHLRDDFEKDGRVTLVNSAEAADATLEVVIVDYHHEIAAVREQDTGLAAKFAVTLSANCTLWDNRSGRPFFENRLIKAQRAVFTDSGDPSSSLVGDQLQSEYNTMPLLAETLANNVVHTVLDVW